MVGRERFRDQKGSFRCQDRRPYRLCRASGKKHIEPAAWRIMAERINDHQAYESFRRELQYIVTIRELHERTGEYIRKAAETGEIYVTDRGKTIARIVPEHDRPQTPYFARRKLTPAFRTPRVYIKLVTKSF